MEVSNLRGLSVVFMFLAFLGICWWAYAPSRKKRFEEDAKLPFADGEDENADVNNSKAQEENNQLHSSTETNAVNEEKRDEK